MTNKSLICWIGGNDLDADTNESRGPILSTIEEELFEEIILLNNYPKERALKFLECVKTKTSANVSIFHEHLSSPIDFEEIYKVADKHLKCLSDKYRNISILISPGTPAMQAVWILLGKTKYPASFIQASIEQGVKRIDIPFDISAEYVPSIKKYQILNFPI